MVSSKVVWRNILYLFFLSQIPYFSRLLIEHPRKVIPAIFYDIIFLLMMLSYHFLQHGVIESMLKENNKAIIDKINERRDSQKHQTLFILVFLIFFCLIICLSIYNPTISIVFFVIMPIISSLTYLWSDDRFDRKKRNKRINR